MADTILVEHLTAGIVRITLNRPKTLNALNADLLNRLVNELRGNAHSRVIILQGAGDRAFCAGEDLKQTLAPKTGTAEELREAFHKLQDITRLTSGGSALIVAAVQGFAIGGGAEIALAADFVIGGRDAKFRFPEASIGHAVTGGISVRLPQMMGLLKAKQLLLTGRYVGAEEALAIGMLTEVVDDPKQRAIQLAHELLKLPKISSSASKMALERAVFPLMENCLQDEVNVASYCFAQVDADQAFTNFAARKTGGLAVSNANGTVTEHSVKAISSSGGAGGKVSTEELDFGVKDINSAWDRAVKKFPNNVFLRFSSEDFTYIEFEGLISRFAGGLRHLGIKAGDRVLVFMNNSVEMVMSWLATNRLGAVWVPVNTQLKSVTLAHVVRAAQATIALADSDLVALLKEVGAVDEASMWAKGGGPAKDMSLISTFGEPLMASVRVVPSATAALLYTSGTTGKSKPCVLSHGYFISQASTLITGCGLVSDDVLYCPFPLFHADATALTTIPAILLGATAALSARFSASRVWDEMRAANATVYDFMGATLALMYKQPPSPRDREHRIRLAWGVPVPAFAPDYESRFGHSLITLYGSVEASLPIFQDSSRPLPLGSCGRVLPGRQLRIANDMDEEVPVNTPGQMLLRCDSPTAFFDGYFNDSEATASAYRNLWLHTGDIGKIDEHGNVYFLGRIKDVIRRRGENINAAELEEEFLQHPEVVVAVAYGIPSELGDGTEEDVKVAVKLKNGSLASEHDLWEWAVTHMARFQVPSVVEIVDEIQRTPTGKFEKHGLKTEGGQRFDIRSASLTASA